MSTTETAPPTESNKDRDEVEHKKSDGKLPVIEVFGPTIQGEGALIGVKTHFIRLGGCDYRCKMCDSLHAVMPEAVKRNARWLTPEDILEELITLGDAQSVPWVTLSGGNPAMWDCGVLVGLLQFAGYKIAIETQGSIWNDWIKGCDQITVSPKGPGMGERFDPEVFRDFMMAYPRTWGRSIKIVVFSQNDLEFAKEVGLILDKIFFPQTERYLSLGNSHPPILMPHTGEINSDPIVAIRSGGFVGTLPQYLLHRYENLLEDYMQEPYLSKWKFLPQLHVLLWGNKSEV